MRRAANGPRSSPPAAGFTRGWGTPRIPGTRRHLSHAARVALGRARLIEIVPAGPSRAHSSAPPLPDEPPVILHPLWATVHARRSDAVDARELRRTHVLHPSEPRRRGARPARRPRPVVPFDIPIEAFAVEVGGPEYPSLRSLRDRRHVYVEHRLAQRRAYRRRQLRFAGGLAGAFVAVAAVALAPEASSNAAGAPARAVAAAATTPVVASARAAAARPVLATGGLVGAPSRAVAVSAIGVVTHKRPAAAPTTATAPASRSVPAGVGTRATGRAIASHGTNMGQVLLHDPFLVCTRFHESIYAGNWHAKSRGGRYSGAYQFDQNTWNHVAEHVGLPQYVGSDPAQASPAIQSLFAYSLYRWQGASHWSGRCAGLA